jgi:RNA polymerase sigma factor (sigma-70 family)
MSGSLDVKPVKRLIEAAVSGDDDSFAELVRRYKRMVLAMASRFTRDGHELDDLCQDIFIKVYENLAGFRGDAPFEHWLRRITVHASYDLLRKRRRELLVPLEDVKKYAGMGNVRARQALKKILGLDNEKR